MEIQQNWNAFEQGTATPGTRTGSWPIRNQAAQQEILDVITSATGIFQIPGSAVSTPSETPRAAVMELELFSLAAWRAPGSELLAGFWRGAGRGKCCGSTSLKSAWQLLCTEPGIWRRLTPEGDTS